MNGNAILDTNILSSLFNEKELSLAQKVENSRFYLSVVVLGELYYGAYKANWGLKRLTQLESLRSSYPILFCDQNTALVYGKIKHQLQQDGHPIPENDIWIAAQAMQYGLTVVTRDQHFTYVKNLNLEQW
jgi:tRNA(fMet)-specific endonuclease VapC